MENNQMVKEKFEKGDSVVFDGTLHCIVLRHYSKDDHYTIKCDDTIYVRIPKSRLKGEVVIGLAK